jgi:hypothetical protein
MFGPRHTPPWATIQREYKGKSVFAAGVVPLTGPYAALRHDEQKGFELAIEHLNNGRRPEMLSKHRIG